MPANRARRIRPFRLRVCLRLRLQGPLTPLHGVMAAFCLWTCAGQTAVPAHADVVYEENFDGSWPFGTGDRAWTDYNPNYGGAFEWESLKSMTCEGEGAIAHTSEIHTADTWVASPSFWLSATGTYLCSFQQRVGNAEFPEQMGTYIWKGAPSAFDPSDPCATLIWHSDEVTNTTCATQSRSFSVAETGSDYHVIFHCTSEANEYLAIWDNLQVTGDPTAVALAAFWAEPSPSGREILIRWQTTSELDHAGFHILRAQGGERDERRITQALIPAQGGPDQGVRYDYADVEVLQGVTYSYRLEALDNGGMPTFHGPISGWAGVANIRANGADGPVQAGLGDEIRMTTEIQALDRGGTRVERWILADTPSGRFSYGLCGWQRGARRAGVGPLGDLPPQTILYRPTVPGNHTFHLMVDDRVNRVPNPTWVDTVEVTVE